MTLIGLIRHGQTDWNFQGRIQGSSDIPLNDTGRAQAAEAAVLLASEKWTFPWSGVLTSPLERAAETGSIIAEALGLPVLGQVPGVAERHYGEAEGMSVDHALRLRPELDFPDSEPETAVTKRGLVALARLNAEYTGQHLLLVAHGGLIRNVLSALHDSPVPTIINSAVSLVHFEDDRKWMVRAINNELLHPESAALRNR
jgi:broad specificity phosphatase PhoE